MNEPRLVDSPEQWKGGTAEGRDCVNQFNQVVLDSIRATGGNNAKRFVMITTYATSTKDVAMDAFKLPKKDKKLIISMHDYYPYKFAGMLTLFNCKTNLVFGVKANPTF